VKSRRAWDDFDSRPKFVATRIRKWRTIASSPFRVGSRFQGINVWFFVFCWLVTINQGPCRDFIKLGLTPFKAGG